MECESEFCLLVTYLRNNLLNFFQKNLYKECALLKKAEFSNIYKQIFCTGGAVKKN